MKSELVELDNGNIGVTYLRYGEVETCDIRDDGEGNDITEDDAHVFVLIQETHIDFETQNYGIVAISHSLSTIQKYLENNPIEHDDNVLDGEEYYIEYLELD